MCAAKEEGKIGYLESKAYYSSSLSSAWAMYAITSKRACITKTCLFKYTETFTKKKNENFQIKNSNIFHISAQNIDCGYPLEPPRRGGSNEYPQSLLFSKIRKIMYTLVLPYKSGVSGGQNYIGMFS